jgi:uncharacterized protein (DUF362 family)
MSIFQKLPEGNGKPLSRRSFFRTSAWIGLGAALASWLPRVAGAQDTPKPPKPKTNIADASKYPRTAESMPGKFPGKVVEVYHPGCVVERKPQEAPAFEMVRAGMLALTGAATIGDAWRMFVDPKDRIGLKVNPVAGKELSTSHEITRAVINQLKDAGIPASRIMIWDRRLFELEETGFTSERYPGIGIAGTEIRDASGSFTGKDGKLYGEAMIDRDWYYWADVEGEYDSETLPYMVNGGKYSYFTKICTKDLDKIINIPILKNAGSSVTLCMKNLAYGAVSNTGRLHKDLWSETTAEVCAFPPIRDKVVLNIADGMIGCYQGGPGANPEFITDFRLMLFGTDPVAVDRVGYDIIYKRRMAEGIQKEESARGREFLNLAQGLGLGTADLDRITHQKINLG